MSISSVNSGPLHVKPEVDLNLATETNRILYVLNKIIDRARFVGLLRFFIRDNGYLLRNILDPNICLQIIQSCNRYAETNESNFNSIERVQQSSSDTSVGSDDADNDDDDIIDDEESLKRQSDSDYDLKTETKRKHDDICEAIYILEENPHVRRLAETMNNKLSPEMKFFIKSLTEFKNLMEKRLTENATQYKTREKYMRETFEKNELAKKQIEKLEDELLVTKTDANVCIIGRNILIRRHQNKISKIQLNSQEVIEKRVKESEKDMVNSWKASTIRQEQLSTDLQQTSEKYANLLKEHLATEKTLRSKRAKVENQVLGWIQKFDQDIGEKQAEEEEIQGHLDAEMQQVNEIQSKLDDQEEEYDELMQEKAQYEEEVLERRMYHFIMNRSARRIQRSFRLYKAQKLAKKLAKKAKKGKKKK